MNRNNQDEELLFTREEKLQYVLKVLKLSTKEVAEKLEISSALVSQIQNYHHGKLRTIHLYALSKAYNIPMEIFKSEIESMEEIDKLLEEKEHNVFHLEKKLLRKLLGTWFVYSYPSNPNLSDIWATETTILDNYSVMDMHKNRGKLYLGEKQSMIVKESHNSKNLTTTLFDNDRITYGSFPFSRIAKSNNFNREILSFGFFSRKKLEVEEAKYILGKIEKVQLQMDYDIIDRITSNIDMRG